MGSLTKGASKYNRAQLGGIATAAGSIIGDALRAGSGAAAGAASAAAAVPWWEVIHGLNILINAALLCMDLKKFFELNKMRNTLNEGERHGRSC